MEERLAGCTHSAFAIGQAVPPAEAAAAAIHIRMNGTHANPPPSEPSLACLLQYANQRAPNYLALRVAFETAHVKRGVAMQKTMEGDGENEGVE